MLQVTWIVLHDGKNMLKKITLLLILLPLLLFTRPVQAAVPGEGLTISPPLVELSLNPGETSKQQVKLTNPTNQLVEVYPSAMNFEASGEGGEPAFTSASASASRYSLANWLSFQEGKIALTPEQVVDFKYQISVPENAEPGGHYGVIFFGTEPPETQKDVSQVALASMIGELILVRVPGDINENASLTDFSTKKFYLKGPVEFSLRIKNLGNIHFKPQGDITIKNMFGNTVETMKVNEAKGNVLPESTRKFTENWQPGGFLFGKFTANTGLNYGETNQNLSGNLNFWIVPIWFIIVVSIIILAIIVLIIWKVKRKKKKQPLVPPTVPERKKVILR